MFYDLTSHLFVFSIKGLQPSLCFKQTKQPPHPSLQGTLSRCSGWSFRTQIKRRFSIAPFLQSELDVFNVAAFLVVFCFRCFCPFNPQTDAHAHSQHNRSSCWVIFLWSISSFSLGLWHLAKQHFFRKSAALCSALLSQRVPCVDLKTLRAGGTDWGHRGMWKNRLLVGARSLTFTHYFATFHLLTLEHSSLPPEVQFQRFLFFVDCCQRLSSYQWLVAWVPHTPLGVSDGKTTGLMTKETRQETNTATHANNKKMSY